MIKYKTRVNYRRKYMTVKGYLIVSTMLILFLVGMFSWAIKGNMALREELLMNQDIAGVIR